VLLLHATDLSWLENEAFEDMYERAGFMTTDDGALVMLAGSTLGGGELWFLRTLGVLLACSVEADAGSVSE
jgi:hypothetical protein